MSKIDELLKNEKVEWKKLGDICEIKTGKLNANEKIENGKYLFFTTSKEISYVNEYAFDGESLLIAGNANIGDIKYYNGKFNAYQRVYVLQNFDNNLIVKYLFYYAKYQLKNYLDNKMNKSAMTYIVLKDLENFQIPIPSVKTQEEIVKTLDKFTNYVTELQAELQFRIKQYEYYRNMLLSEEYLNKLSEKYFVTTNYSIRITTLGEIGSFTRGNGLQKKDFISAGNPVIHYGQIYTTYNFETDKVFSFVDDSVFSKLKKAKYSDILIATTSENFDDVGKAVVWLGHDEVGFSGDMYCYSTGENSKYIAYYFQTTEFQKQKEKKVTGTKLIRIHGDDMSNFLISLPPIEIQNKIVQILDKFQDLLSNTKGLLPQEIAQRQKQYEYYREKLLTFNIDSATIARQTDR